MRLASIVLATATALGAAACDDPASDQRHAADAGAVDGVPSVDATPSADAAIDAGDGCATAPTGDWDGTALIRDRGAGGFDQVSATVHWTRVSTAACVDRYQPSGTARYETGGNCHWITDPDHAAIDATDGELVIDRSTAPATYTMHGASHWAAVGYCENDPPGDPFPQTGGPWVDQSGSFDGAVLAGNLAQPVAFTHDVTWRVTRAGAIFTPPSACAEPAAAQWRSVTEIEASDRLTATVTWTRVATDGCVDTFTPAGTIVYGFGSGSDCTTTIEPHQATIDAADGTLTIDRSTAPPTFRIAGATQWDALYTCTYPDGSSTSQSESVGGPWAGFDGAYDGARFGATVTGFWDERWSWRLERL